MRKGQDGKNDVPDKIFSLGRDLNYTSGACNRLVQSLLDPHDLPTIYWVILTALWRSQRLSVSQIAEYYGVKPPAASRLLTRMERDGWVEQISGISDRRVKLFAATAKAKEAAHLLSVIEAVNEKLMTGLSKKERAQFRQLLAKVRQNALEGTAAAKTKPE